MVQVDSWLLDCEKEYDLTLRNKMGAIAPIDYIYGYSYGYLWIFN